MPSSFRRRFSSFQLALARGLLGGGIGVLGTGSARCAARGGEDAWDLGAAAVGAGREFVAADLRAVSRCAGRADGRKELQQRGRRTFLLRHVTQLRGLTAVDGAAVGE